MKTGLLNDSPSHQHVRRFVNKIVRLDYIEDDREITEKEGLLVEGENYFAVYTKESAFTVFHDNIDRIISVTEKKNDELLKELLEIQSKMKRRNDLTGLDSKLTKWVK